MTKEELFEQYSYVVYCCYSKLYKDEFIEAYKEDLLQEGLLALWRACNTYDETLETKMFSYAYAAIHNTMLKWIRKNRGYYYNYVSLEDSVKDTYNDLITLNDTLGCYDDTDVVITQVAEIVRLYRRWLIKTRVNSNEIYINNRVYVSNIILNELIMKDRVTVRHIEEEYGICRTTVSKIFKELRECLKETYPTRFKNGERRSGTD